MNSEPTEENSIIVANKLDELVAYRAKLSQLISSNWNILFCQVCESPVLGVKGPRKICSANYDSVVCPAANKMACKDCIPDNTLQCKWCSQYICEMCFPYGEGKCRKCSNWRENKEDSDFHLGYGLAYTDPIVQKAKNLLVKIDLRDDYNGRPSLIETSEGKFLLRTHPDYCFSTENGHYGRVYEYRIISTDTNQGFSPDFYACVYDTVTEYISSGLDDIISALNKGRTDIKFSALLPDYLEKNKKKYLKKPRRLALHIQPAKPRTPEKVVKYLVSGKASRKKMGYIITPTGTYSLVMRADWKGGEDEVIECQINFDD
jgi:hypothetical protein